MISCTGLMQFSTILIGASGMPQKSKLMTAAREVPVMRNLLRRVAVQYSRANSHVEPADISQTGNHEDCDRGYDCDLYFLLHDFSDEKYGKEAEALKQQVTNMLQNTSASGEQLELIDDLQRLGVAYHFDTEIKRILDRIYYKICKNGDYDCAEADLHTAALTFRLLRQNGYFVTQDIFSSFIDNDTGVFKLSLVEDIKGMLSLYEASFLTIEGETLLEEGLNFTSTYFHKLKISEKLVADEYLYALLTHALEMPLHWRTQRLEARWFIETYPRRHDMNSCLLQLAKLDFNRVQGMYRDELQNLSRWWENLGLAKAMDFVRDSLVISYVWSASIYWEPEYESTRKVFAQAIALLTTFDDVYDVNGSLDELELFTSAVERWDAEGKEKLPHHMKMCFMALNHFINESARLSLDNKGVNSLPTLRKAWTTLLKSYLKESRWYHTGYQPTLEEYMSNARISVGVYTVTMHAYIFDPKTVSEAELNYLESEPDILKWVAIIFRACNDLGTSQEELKRGTDNPNSVQCYMHETNTSQEAAVKHVRDLVTNAWKKLNKIRFAEVNFPLSTVNKFVDTARASLSIYQYTNQNGMEDSVTEDLISKILHDPISP